MKEKQGRPLGWKKEWELQSALRPRPELWAGDVCYWARTHLSAPPWPIIHAEAEEQDSTLEGSSSQQPTRSRYTILSSTKASKLGSTFSFPLPPVLPLAGLLRPFRTPFFPLPSSRPTAHRLQRQVNMAAQLFPAGVGTVVAKKGKPTEGLVGRPCRSALMLPRGGSRAVCRGRPGCLLPSFEL